MPNTTTELPDAKNPAYMFQTIHTDLLVAIARGEINPVELAKQELANRGLDIRTGKWVGFERARETAKLHGTIGPKGQTIFVSIPE